MTTSWETLAALAAKGEIRLHLDLASILGYILIGLVVGLVARFIVPGRDPIGLLGTLLIGVIGAVIGGWLAGGGFAGTAGGGWVAPVFGLRGPPQRCSAAGGGVARAVEITSRGTASAFSTADRMSGVWSIRD